MTTREHKHTDECWEPDSGCDMGKNPEFVAVVKRPTRELIEAVRVKYWYVRGPYSEELASNLHPIVKRADYDALRAATLAVLDDLIACRGEHGGWRVAAGDNGPMALNKVLPNARALREKLK